MIEGKHGMTSKDIPYQPAPPLWTRFPNCESPTEPLPQEGSDLVSNEAPDSRSRVVSVLELWLEWNEAYQTLTQRMYEEKTNFHQLEMMADQLDALRLKAVEETRRLLVALQPCQ